MFEVAGLDIITAVGPILQSRKVGVCFAVCDFNLLLPHLILTHLNSTFEVGSCDDICSDAGCTHSSRISQPEISEKRQLMR